MAHRLDPTEAIDAARTDVAEDQMARLFWTAADVERAIRNATAAEAIAPPECWRLAGGTTPDGEPAVIEIDVTDRFVRILSVARA